MMSGYGGGSPEAGRVSQAKKDGQASGAADMGAGRHLRGHAGIVIDDRGEACVDEPRALAARLGCRTADFDVISYAVRNFGFIHIGLRENGIRVALRANRFSLLTLTSTLFKLADLRPARILLAIFWGDDWSYEMFNSIGAFTERAEDLAAGEPVVRRPSWLAAERNLSSLAAPTYERLQPLVRLWREQRGALPEDLPQTLNSLDLLNRSVIVRQRRRTSRLTVEHFGAGIKMLKPCEGMMAVGRDLHELPDGAYGDWVADSYARALAGRRVRLDGVRATLKNSESTTIRVRYDRLLMPWRTGKGDGFVLSVSMRRELSTVA